MAYSLDIEQGYLFFLVEVLGLEVDFIFPLSQEEEEQQHEQSQPNLKEGSILYVLNWAQRLN